MKKTLAILLALLAATSITLASCKDDGRSTLDDDWNDEDNDYVETDDETDDNDDGDDTSGSQGNGENNNDNNNDNTNTNPTDWETKDDTVYAGVKIKLRAEASTTSETIATIPFGSALSRSETNGRWDKVTYNGKTGYVSHTYVSLNSSDFSFNDCEPVSITLKENGDRNVCFYLTPFSPGGFSNFETFSGNVLLASGLKAANLSKGYTMKKLAVSQSGSWVKVELTGTVTIQGSTKTCNAEVFYIRALAFNRGDIVDSTWNSGSNPGGDSAFG